MGGNQITPRKSKFEGIPHFELPDPIQMHEQSTFYETNNSGPMQMLVTKSEARVSHLFEWRGKANQVMLVIKINNDLLRIEMAYDNSSSYHFCRMVSQSFIS